MEYVELCELIRRWCLAERIDDAVRDAMLAVAADEPDYWAGVSLWRLHEVAREARRSF